MIIDRDIAPKLIKSAQKFPSVTLTGPRQSGKTTLCKTVFPKHPYVNLESHNARTFATEDPVAFLGQFPDGAIIDEVQRVPDLLSRIQCVIDEDRVPGRWILVGSQNLYLLKSISQSLAGRTAVHNLLPLTRNEIMRFGNHSRNLEQVLISGAYPEMFALKTDPEEWFSSYITGYVDRDVRTITNVGDILTFHKFLSLCAGRTAQLLNYSSLAEDCGISQPSAKAWFSILETSFIAFRLPAFFSNLRRRKRLVRTPKLHFYDAGLVCWLLDIRTPAQLRSHPLRGAIFETWAVSEVVKHRINRAETRGLSFYRDRNGVDVDLVVEDPSRITLVEAKSTKTASSSLLDGPLRVRKHLAESFRPCELAAIYGGDQLQKRSDGNLIPWNKLHESGL